MNLYLRLLIVLLRSLWKRRISPMQPVVSAFRVLPGDLDLLGHMNNGRYLQIMDVARIDWMRQARILDAVVTQRWGALLGGTIIRHARALNLLQRYRVVTRVAGWDRRWFYLEHRFQSQDGQLVAVGWARAALRKAGRWVSTEDVIDAVWPGLTSPEYPIALKKWLAADLHLGPDFNVEPTHADGEPNTSREPSLDLRASAEG